MQLLTSKLEERFAQLGEQADTKNPIVVAKFFNPSGAGTWFACHYVPEQRLFYGYVSIFGDHCDEWGYFSLDELESVRGPFGLGIERDVHFREGRAEAVIGDFYRQRGIKDPRPKK